MDEVIEPIVYDEAIELIRAHRDAGRRVVHRVGVTDRDRRAARPLPRRRTTRSPPGRSSTSDGRYTGEVEFYSYGPFKVEAMERARGLHDLDLGCCFAYSDSVTDLPMLEAVGHPVAVNPDRDLLRVARERNWEVANFGREVALRDRVAMPSPAQTAAGAAGLAGVVAGGVVWWWLRRPDGGSAATTVAPGRPTGRRDQAERTFFAATAARATNTARSSSFFIARKCKPGRRPAPARLGAAVQRWRTALKPPEPAPPQRWWVRLVPWSS